MRHEAGKRRLLWEVVSPLLATAAFLLGIGCGSGHAVGGGEAAASGEGGPAGEHRQGALARIAEVDLPHGAPGIGFDDLRYSPEMSEVLVPAGRSGRLDLVDPASRAVLEVPGFSELRTFPGGHDAGVTSADAGTGAFFATDRTTERLAVVDASSREIVRTVPLAAHPDYVRYVAATHEVWVTEPDAEQLEVFSLGEDGLHPSHAGLIAVPGGPESLVIDPVRSRAYTHLWRGRTVALDLLSRSIVARWKNGCRSSRGIALDANRGLLVVACAEGRASVLDVRDGRSLSELETGAGVDVIDFDPRSRHVFLPSSSTATMVVAALSPDGRLHEIGRVATALGAHCVAADRRGDAFVCDPARGRLLVIHDGLERAAP